jgi:hypothetical protein
MTATGRRVRLAATAVVLVLLLAGSVWGEDDHFPFGPFRMYSTSGRPDGVVRTPALVGVIDGDAFRIDPQSLGVRRAELEGHLNRFRTPGILPALAAEYEEETGRALDELRLVTVRRPLRDSRPTGESESTIERVWRP